MPYSFAIIGGGLTATSMLCQLVDRLIGMDEEGRRLSRELSIAVFEKKTVFGPGLPHSKEIVLPFHITNMCAQDMSVQCDLPGDFDGWVQQHPDVLRSIRGDEDDSGCGDEQCRHYPRAVMGDYLKTRFKEAVEAAGNRGITVELHACSEVIDLVEEGPRIHIIAEEADGTPSGICTADSVLLATGHWFETDGSKNFLPSPWPASRLLAAIPGGAEVGVIGSSLSAIEVALTLTSDGRFVRRPSGELIYAPSASPRRITLHSRNGLLPRVRGRVGRRPNRYLTCDKIRRLIHSHPGAITLSSVFDLLDRELTAAYGRPVDWQLVISPQEGAAEVLRHDIHNARMGDGPDGELVWQTVLVEIFPVVRDLYLNLTLEERERFDRHFNTLFFMHAATQPVINGEKLLALMEAGIVSIVKLGSDYRLDRKGVDGPFTLVYRDVRGRRSRTTYPYVVNACGQPRSIESDHAILSKNLLKRGLVQIEENRGADPHHTPPYHTGSVVVDPGTHRVIRPGTEGMSPPYPPIYAVGAMTRGQMIDASMAYGIIRSTARVADDLIARLRRSY